MSVTVPSFRGGYPEFADQTRYPNGMVAHYLAFALKMMDADRWGELIDEGTMLFTAHHCTLRRRAMDQADNGDAPGGASGPVNSRSVDKVSVGFDTGAGTIEGGAQWNLTVYGIEFLQMMKLVGAGPIQVGAEFCADPLGSAFAWPGPPQSLFPNGSG